MGAPPELLRRVMVTRCRLLVPPLAAAVASLAHQGGATAVLLREKELGTEDLAALAREVRDACPVPVIVAHDPEAARRARATGVHLGWTSPGLAAARRICEPGMLVGVSVHGLGEGLARAAEGADYLLFGPIRETPKEHGIVEPLGFTVLGDLARRVTIPVVAIGGLGSSEEERVRAAGAAGWAAIRAFLPASSS